MSVSSEDSIDEDLEENLPICVQGSLAKLRRQCSKLRQIKSNLTSQLEKSELRCQELARQVETLESQLSSCVQCKKLQLQLDEVGERLGNGQLSWAPSEVVSVATQTGDDVDHGGDWSLEGEEDIAAQVSSAASSVMEQQGMVYEETSGLYYHYKSGYYFDAATGLYYDGHNGVWYQYDSETGQYKVNSRVPEEEVRAQKILSQAARDNIEARRICREKKRKKAEKPDLADAIDKINNVLANHEYSDESDDESSMEIIPCVRIVVLSTEDPDVVTGTLFLITCKGGSIGCRGHHEVLLNDKGCSKHHARISFNNGKYFIKDLGSRNGTWVGGKRISVSKQESEDIEIGHGSLVQIGKTKLLCHLHPGRETCLECEPGLVRVNKDNSINQVDKEGVRKENLHTLKRKYGLDNPGEDLPKSEDKNKYFDRARDRRKLVGSSHSSEKTASSSVDTAISSDNKGYKMLAKMGFKPGSQGLGKNNQGRQEPVKVEQRGARVGLGSDGPAASVESRKNAIWLKTQKRFNNSQVLEAFNEAESDDDNHNNKSSS